MRYVRGGLAVLLLVGVPGLALLVDQLDLGRVGWLVLLAVVAAAAAGVAATRRFAGVEAEGNSSDG